METYQTIIGIFLGVLSLERGVLLAVRRRRPLAYNKSGVAIFLLFVALSALMTTAYFREMCFSFQVFNTYTIHFLIQCTLYLFVFLGCFPILEASFSENWFHQSIDFFDKNYIKIFMFFLFLRLLSAKHFFVLIP